MKKILSGLKNIFRLFLVVLIAFPTNLAGAVFAESGNSEIETIINTGPTVVEEDGVVLYKTAEPVEGVLNKYKITLKIESPKLEKKSDTVIVIDRSGSMGDDGKLTKAKSAAKSLAEQLLPAGNTTNRIAIVSFASDVTIDLNFSSSYSAVAAAIDGIDDNGGTFTQAAVHTAANLLSGSTADIKNMVLLSDGEPTYSYGFTDSAIDDDDNFVSYGSSLQTSSGVSSSVFDYDSTVGDGRNLHSCIGGTNFWGRCRSDKYYNNGNSAIAEAGFYKNASPKIGDLYTIALNAGTSGTSILQQMASAGKAYTATPEQLESIFNAIGGKILAAVQSASVEDTMGTGVIVSATGASQLETWHPKFELVDGKFVATMTYEVELTDDIIGATGSSEYAGFYPLNSEATLSYNGKTEKFPVPYVKPTYIKAKKVVVDATGKTSENAKFDIKLVGPNGFSKTKSVKNGETVSFVAAFPVGEYHMEEVATTNNSVKLENYIVSYDKTAFTVSQENPVDTLVTITNKYEEVSVSAKKSWEDDKDRDGKRKNYKLYFALKDGNKFVDFEEIGTTDKSFTFEELPKTRNGQDINYTVVEAKNCSKSNGTVSCTEFTDDGTYSVDYKVENGVTTITNTHEPELYNTTGELTVKKIWQQGSLITLPDSITIELLANGEVLKTVDVFAGTGWSHTFDGLYKYDGGELITYSVREKSIFGASAFGNAGNVFIVYGSDVVAGTEQKSVEGKWTSSVSNFNVTNTWTGAESVYNGETEFYIKKIDENGKVMSGVTFEVNGKEYTTDAQGKVKVKIAATPSVREDNLTFEVKETETLDGYDLVTGSATVKVKSTSELVSVDEAGLKNTYSKTYNFTKSGSVDFVWDKDSKTLIVTNNRSLAGSLTIRKEFSGVTAEALIRNGLKFKISGPEDFTEQEISFADFTEVEDGVYEYKVIGRIPTGEYKVEEFNAEFEGLLDLTVDDDDAEKTVKKGENAVLTIKNEYKKIRDVSYTVVKKWEDGNDQDGKRPDELEVTLLRNGRVYKTFVLDDDNDWEHTWTNLPRADENAETYRYSVEEPEVADYDSDGGKMVDGKFVFTNTHTPETVTIIVNKTWDDGENADKLRDDVTTITFCVTGSAEDYTSEPVCQTVLTGVGVQTDAIVFEELPKYHEGELLNYEVTESGMIDGYVSSLVPGEYVTIVDGVGTQDVTNTHVVSPEDPCVNGGCGGVTPDAPDTGESTSEAGSTVNYAVGPMMMACFTILMLAFGVRKNKKEN